MAIKYHLNFDGSIGDFIKKHRKAKKINSTDLSKELGKSIAYVSQIESGRNKSPDFNMLYEIFKKIGIDKDKIEDYLESFGYLSPEREQQQIDEQMDRYEMDNEEYKQYEEYEKEIRNSHPEYFINNGDQLLKEIINGRLNKINATLRDISLEDSGNGFTLVKNIENTLTDMKSDKNLYLFMQRLFDNNLSLLDESSLIKILNDIYYEMNKAEKENASWGQPNMKEEIDKL